MAAEWQIVQVVDGIQVTIPLENGLNWQNLAETTWEIQVAAILIGFKHDASSALDWKETHTPKHAEIRTPKPQIAYNSPKSISRILS